MEINGKTGSKGTTSVPYALCVLLVMIRGKKKTKYLDILIYLNRIYGPKMLKMQKLKNVARSAIKET